MKTQRQRQWTETSHNISRKWRSSQAPLKLKTWEPGTGLLWVHVLKDYGDRVESNSYSWSRFTLWLLRNVPIWNEDTLLLWSGSVPSRLLSHDLRASARPRRQARAEWWSERSEVKVQSSEVSPGDDSKVSKANSNANSNIRTKRGFVGLVAWDGTANDEPSSTVEECGREVEMNRLAALCKWHERKACNERHVCLRYERELCQTQSCCWNLHVNLFVALSCDIGAGLVLVYWFFPVF